MPTLDSDPTYYNLDTDDAAGAQPSAMQQFLDSIAPGLSPPLTGGAAPLPSPYAAAQRAKMSNAQFAQYFARRIAVKFGAK